MSQSLLRHGSVNQKPRFFGSNNALGTGLMSATTNDPSKETATPKSGASVIKEFEIEFGESFQRFLNSDFFIYEPLLVNIEIRHYKVKLCMCSERTISFSVNIRLKEIHTANAIKPLCSVSFSRSKWDGSKIFLGKSSATCL